MSNSNKWLLLIALLAVVLLGFSIMSACGDDDDDDDDSVDDDFEDDDDVTDDDDDSVDDDTTDDDDDDEWDFYYEDVQGMAPIGNAVYAATIQGVDVLAAMAILGIDMSSMKQDAVEWDMMDGLPAGDYTFNIPEGSDYTGDENPSMVVVFGMSLLGVADAAYIAVSGDAIIETTGWVDDPFKGHVENVEFRPVSLTTGEVDWSGPKGFVEYFGCDTIIKALPGGK